MECRVVYLNVLIVLLTWMESHGCPTGCMCTDHQKIMACTGLTAIPQDVDPQFTNFIFDNCNFHGELSKMPAAYNQAHLLQIIHSNVQSIGSGAFQDLQNLSMLSLAGNKITHIGPPELAGLSSLLKIDLRDNLITVLPDELFRHSPKISKVILSDNPLTTISDRAFAQPEDDDKPGAESLIQYIELENCNLKTIPTAALCMSSMVPNLESLDLSRNNFLNLDDNLFGHLAGIVSLELDSCEMKCIGKETFAGLTRLQNLRLSNNILSSIDEDAFEDFFGALKYLHLDYNQLTALPYGLFNWAVMEVLNISNNPWECSCTNGWMQEYNVSPNDTNYHVMCASPEQYEGMNAVQVMKYEMEPCAPPSSGPDPLIALYIAIPIIIILCIIAIFIIVKICILKKKESHGRSAQYSLVYKPTTEKV